MKSSLDKIFYKIVYHYIIYMCDFFDKFRRFFSCDLHEFSQRLWFAPDTFPCSSASFSYVLSYMAYIIMLTSAVLAAYS